MLDQCTIKFMHASVRIFSEPYGKNRLFGTVRFFLKPYGTIRFQKDTFFLKKGPFINRTVPYGTVRFQKRTVRFQIVDRTVDPFVLLLPYGFVRLPAAFRKP